MTLLIEGLGGAVWSRKGAVRGDSARTGLRSPMSRWRGSTTPRSRCRDGCGPVTRPRTSRRFRDVAVWIGGTTPHTASHVGPQPERVPALVDDRMRFARRTDLPVIPHMALAHAQFETIHPFPDGNGRAGRALVHAMLRSSGTTRQVTVPVSAGLLADPEGYFDALDEYRAGNPVPIVEVFTDSTSTV